MAKVKCKCMMKTPVHLLNIVLKVYLNANKRQKIEWLKCSNKTTTFTNEAKIERKLQNEYNIVVNKA